MIKANPKVAIVYDRVNKFGGAERVLLSLRKLFPESVLVTSVYEPNGASWADGWEVRTSFLQNIPWARKHHEWFALLMPFAFESLDLSEFDLIISVTSEFAKNLVTNSNQLHICICLTPTRYLWSHTNEYARGKFSFLKRIAFSHLRIIDYVAAQRPQKMIAISQRVADRIKLYYGREAKIIFPSLSLPQNKLLKRTVKNYYLVVSRLVSYKRVDLAISACIKLKRHLHIVGIGSEGMNLLALTKNNPYIHFEGAVSDEKLTKLYLGARALICPQEEDFGLVGLEAGQLGVPVISYKNSGVSEVVAQNKTGILFEAQTAKSLESAMIKFEKQVWDEVKIKRHALAFSEKKFHKELLHEVQ